jgi:predicted AAA+ superfamily ATPase
MLENRYLLNYAMEDLEEKMVFIGGPRQVGKTTLARDIFTIFYGADGDPVFFSIGNGAWGRLYE